MQNEPQLTAEMRKHCMCERCKDGVIHAACCAVHNMPAEPNGECDCEPETPAFSEDLSYYWQRILGEDWTNNQPLYELYLWVVKELATALEEQIADLKEIFDCPYIVNVASCPNRDSSRAEEAPDQVVGTLHMSYRKYKKLLAILNGKGAK